MVEFDIRPPPPGNELPQVGIDYQTTVHETGRGISKRTREGMTRETRDDDCNVDGKQERRLLPPAAFRGQVEVQHQSPLNKLVINMPSKEQMMKAMPVLGQAILLALMTRFIPQLRMPTAGFSPMAIFKLRNSEPDTI